MLLAGPVARVPGGCLSAAGRAGAGSRSCHSQPRSPAARASGPRRPAATAGYGRTGAGCRPVASAQAPAARPPALAAGRAVATVLRPAASGSRLPATPRTTVAVALVAGSGWPGQATRSRGHRVRGWRGPGVGPAAAGQAAGLGAAASPPRRRSVPGWPVPAARARGPAAWAATWQASPGYGVPGTGPEPPPQHATLGHGPAARGRRPRVRLAGRAGRGSSLACRWRQAGCPTHLAWLRATACRQCPYRRAVPAAGVAAGCWVRLLGSRTRSRTLAATPASQRDGQLAAGRHGGSRARSLRLRPQP